MSSFLSLRSHHDIEGLLEGSGRSLTNKDCCHLSLLFWESEVVVVVVVVALVDVVVLAVELVVLGDADVVADADDWVVLILSQDCYALQSHLCPWPSC